MAEWVLVGGFIGMVLVLAAAVGWSVAVQRAYKDKMVDHLMEMNRRVDHRLSECHSMILMGPNEELQRRSQELDAQFLEARSRHIERTAPGLVAQSGLERPTHDNGVPVSYAQPDEYDETTSAVD